jgi:hypothetical protein
VFSLSIVTTSAHPLAMLADVPATARAEQVFGWGKSGLAWLASLVIAAHAAGFGSSFLGSGYPREMLAYALPFALGPYFVVRDLRRRRARVVLAPLASGFAVYREGRLAAILPRSNVRVLVQRRAGTWAYGVVYLALFGGLVAAATVGMHDAAASFVMALFFVPVSALAASPVYARITCGFYQLVGVPGLPVDWIAFRRAEAARVGLPVP